MAKEPVQEVNFDGLIGPTHNYSGLSWGNLASLDNRHAVSNPRQAALEGLAKMKALADLGYPQGILPPHERPFIPALRKIGFTGDDAKILRDAGKLDPVLVAKVSSASAMWAANAATVTGSAESGDGRVHFTPANLQTAFHRSLEHPTTGRILRAIFSDEGRFAHHDALPSSPEFSDEGAANHTRLSASPSGPGIGLFVYGRSGTDAPGQPPIRFPARQTLEASRAIARQHGIREEHRVFARQNPVAIDGGVFHNDVICVGTGPVLFYHELAFAEEEAVLEELSSKLGAGIFKPICVPKQAVSLQDAVQSYLFNSQLLQADDGFVLAVPVECRENPNVWNYLAELVNPAGPITAVDVFDVKQSMRNGGGPACLRLRVPLTDAERATVARGVMLNDSLHEVLSGWVRAHYRDRLTPRDLAAPSLLDESRAALDELTGLLGLGPIYDFQL